MILVTGATGTVGSQIVAELTRGGQPVRVLTRSRGKQIFSDRLLMWLLETSTSPLH